MHRSVTIARWIFGLFMFVNGLNHFFPMYPLPPVPQIATDFTDQLELSGLFAFAKALEVLGGAMLIANMFVPAAIAILMPVSAFVFVIDVVLVGGVVGYTAGPLVMAFNLYLLFAYFGYYLPLLTLRSRPTGLGALRHWQADWPVPPAE